MDRCLLLFIAGVAVSLYLPNSATYGWAVSACLIATSIGYSVPRTRIVATAIVALFCGIAAATANLNWQFEQRTSLLQSTESAVLPVQIIDVPHQYTHHTRFLVEVNSNVGALIAPPPRLMLTWYGPDGANVRIGQRWEVTVSLAPFHNYWNEGSRDYLAAMQRHRVLLRGSVKKGHLLAAAATPRSRLATVLQHDERPHNGILAALSLGIRDYLTTQQWQQWQAAGLTHALAISGLHLSLVGWAGLVLGRVIVARALSWRKNAAGLERTSVQSLSWLLALVIAFCYAWLADFSIATLRALLMFFVVVLHRILAMTVSPWQLLLRTVALLLIIDPLALLDIGFWLSVTALLTILLTLWRWHQVGGNRLLAMLLMQLMFLIVMAPLSLYWFGGVALLSPLTNLVMLPIISLWILPLTLVGTLAELSFAHQFADNIWFLATLPLIGIYPLLTKIAAWHWSWWQPPVAVPLAALFTLLMLVLMPIAERVLKLTLIICVPLTVVAFYSSRGRDEVFMLHILDVGQSQAVVIERAGRAWVVDTAVSYGSGYSLANTVITPFLTSRQLQLEGGWVSHSDNDHSGGVRDLQTHFPTAIWYGATTTIPCEQGMAGTWNDIKWQVHWPPRKHEITKTNNRSCVISLHFGNFSVLLPGDIEFNAERAIAESVGFPAVDVLVAPHHGSKTSSGWLMLKQTRPSLVLISNGEHKGFDFPHRYTEARYRHMQRLWFNTKDQGQLTVVSDGVKWWLNLPYADKRQRRLYRIDD